MFHATGPVAVSVRCDGVDAVRSLPPPLLAVAPASPRPAHLGSSSSPRCFGTIRLLTLDPVIGTRVKPDEYLVTTEAETLKPLLWKSSNLVRAIEAAGVTLWSWNVETDALAMDDHAYDLWGISRSTDVSFEDLSAHIHPADRDRVRAAFHATRAIIGPFEIDFRIMISDELRWISARGQGDDEGIVRDIIDVTGRKQAEESRELLAGEMTHRVKNMLAIASGLAHMTALLTKTTSQMASELTRRLIALGRAHDPVRPEGDDRRVRHTRPVRQQHMTAILGSRAWTICGIAWRDEVSPVHDRVPRLDHT